VPFRPCFTPFQVDAVTTDLWLGGITPQELVVYSDIISLCDIASMMLGDLCKCEYRVICFLKTMFSQCSVVHDSFRKAVRNLTDTLDVPCLTCWCVCVCGAATTPKGEGWRNFRRKPKVSDGPEVTVGPRSPTVYDWCVRPLGSRSTFLALAP
jgi:hypothetical protein